METSYTNRDEMISSITRSKQQSVLGKRPKVTTEQLIKEAQDVLVFQTSQSALLGGENPKLNFEEPVVHKKQKTGEDSFKVPLPVGGKKAKLTPQNLEKLTEESVASAPQLRDAMGINAKLESERQSSLAGSMPRRPFDASSNWESFSISRFSSISQSPSAMANNRLWQKELQAKLTQLPPPQDMAYVDYDMLVEQLEEEITMREADIKAAQTQASERYMDEDEDMPMSDDGMAEDREDMLERQLEQLQNENQSKLKTRSSVFQS
jgi:hypothetical protein